MWAGFPQIKKKKSPEYFQEPLLKMWDNWGKRGTHFKNNIFHRWAATTCFKTTHYLRPFWKCAFILFWLTLNGSKNNVVHFKSNMTWYQEGRLCSAQKSVACCVWKIHKICCLSPIACCNFTALLTLSSKCLIDFRQHPYETKDNTNWTR